MAKKGRPKKIGGPKMKSFHLRIPEELHSDIEKLADADERSVNKYIERAMKEHCEEKKKVGK